MATGTALRLAATLQVKLREDTLPISALAGVLATYAALRYAVYTTAGYSGQASLTLEAFTVAAAAAVSSIRYGDIATPLRILMRGIAIVVLIQLAFDTSTFLYLPDMLMAGSQGVLFRVNAMIGLAAGVVAIWRPSFVVPLLISYVTFRRQFNVHAGIEISETDYLSMLDIGLFTAIGACALALGTKIFGGALTASRIAADKFKESAGHLVWACAVGAHLGNYLISGWTKVRAGGDDPLLWLFQNPTQTSILIGLERGNNLFATWPDLLQGSWNGIVAAGVALNAFVLLTQVAAPLALLHRRTLMAVTVLFDLFHVGVYLTLGALFHFWLAVNVLILLSARRLDDKAYTPTMKMIALASVLGGHFLFYTSHLGWLDGAKLASPSITAETRDGRQVPVPGVYLGLWSYSMAQTALYIPDDHFPMRMGGNSYNPTDWRDATTCGPQTLHRQDTGVTQTELDEWIRGVDRAMRRHPAVKNANLYYLYPHHMVANPLVFREFNRLKIEDIVGYRYVVESVCLSLDEGRLKRDVRRRTEHEIELGL